MRCSRIIAKPVSTRPSSGLAKDADVIVIDTPGRDDELARSAILRADTLVTPMNDSFVDLDLIGQVHPENFKVTKPSFYAELIWNSRTQRAKETGKSVDWVVLRNRLQHVESHNLRRVGAALDELARRVGFRVIPGLGERVIYRELFPKGLTLLDLQQLGEVGIAHITARQELREMIAGLGIPDPGEIAPIAAAAGNAARRRRGNQNSVFTRRRGAAEMSVRHGRLRTLRVSASPRGHFWIASLRSQ